MEFTAFLKRQLVEFVDVYKLHFKRTSGIAFTFSIFCLIAIAILLRYSSSELAESEKRTSLASFLFAWSSTYNNYCFLDVSKSIFLFFVSAFSLSFLRFKAITTEPKPFNFSNCFKNLQLWDIVSLVAVLLTCTGADYLLYQLSNMVASNGEKSLTVHWAYWVIYFTKVYLPLLLFSVNIQWNILGRKFIFNFKRIVYLLVILWLFNEFAYNLYFFVHHYIFTLVTIPFQRIDHFVFESFISSLLLTVYFLGYYSAMTSTLPLSENE